MRDIDVLRERVEKATGELCTLSDEQIQAFLNVTKGNIGDAVKMAIAFVQSKDKSWQRDEP